MKTGTTLDIIVEWSADANTILSWLESIGYPLIEVNPDSEVWTGNGWVMRWRGMDHKSVYLEHTYRVHFEDEQVGMLAMLYWTNYRVVSHVYF